MGEIDAAGEAMTGALLARTVEPVAGEHGGSSRGLCLNCGTALIGPHCHRCGQPGHVHRTIGAIGHEILHGVVHFEGKLWRTLPLLAWRPGELTRRYIAGERARFVSPMALFLFSVFTMFAVFSMAGLSPPADLGQAQEEIARGFNDGASGARTGMQRLRNEYVRRRDALPAGDPRRARLDTRIEDLDRKLARGEANQVRVFGQPQRKGEINTGWPRLDEGIEKTLKNPSLALYKLQSNSYKFSWLLIPLSLPFVWLMFAWKRRYHGFDHAVFVTYSIAFMSLLFIVVTILGSIGVSSEVLIAATLLIPTWHMYRQLRGAYSLRRWTAALRTLFLLTMIVGIIAPTFLIILLLLGLVG